MRHHCAFLGETFNVFCFLCEITQRNKKRKVSIAVSGGAKHCIEAVLHVFPNAIAPRANDHATAHIAWFGQFGGAHDLLIPFWKIFFTPRTDRGFLGGRIRHGDNELISGR